MNYFRVFLYFCSFLYVCECHVNKCVIKESCGACIRDPNCVWCSNPFTESTKLQRCELLENSKNINWCPAKYVINPQSELQIIKNVHFQSSTENKKGIIHISPQEIKLKLRTKSEYEFKFVLYMDNLADDKVTDSMKITDNFDDNIKVKYYSACQGTEEKETNECNNLNVGVKVDFKAVITLVNCPDILNKNRLFEIKLGALNKSLIVAIEMICSCECEKNGTNKAPQCHYSGSLQCGICSCDPGYYGSNCECNKDNFNDCRVDNTSEICSGLGTCICNKCYCNERINVNERIYGEFCECDNYSCKRNRGLLCSGSDHGQCDCGKCLCLPDWYGEACECYNNKKACISPNGLLCSGHGYCICGQCECHDIDGYKYYGKYCEKHPFNQL